jgi:hypothetical protein
MVVSQLFEGHHYGTVGGPKHAKRREGCGLTPILFHHGIFLLETVIILHKRIRAAVRLEP